ncbi:hypothetical protein [Streptomyces longispororuber]|uniref:hypothetical protein n=1 Tax=Streptomyces longispororuber TaxID=68230 RepID=UPI00210DD922|nr:hypothetical protein [Streptomyces longispororuber]MCQ4214252.1 hypothetical protein [Streptomyces longispororuber]
MTRAAHHLAYSTVRRRKSGRSISFTLIAAALTATTLTACSTNDKAGPEATLEPTASAKDPADKTATAPSPTATDPDAALKKTVLDTYDRMWDEQVKAYAQASIKGTDLRRFSAGPALADAEIAMETYREKGIVAQGAPTHDVTITGLKPDKKVPWASLTDCLDTAPWKRVYAKTGKSVEMPKSRVPKYVTKVQAEKWGATWKIVEVKPSATSC